MLFYSRSMVGRFETPKNKIPRNCCILKLCHELMTFNSCESVSDLHYCVSIKPC